MGDQKAKNEILVQIGKRLVQARSEKNYTQEKVAELTGFSMQMISNAENGHKAMRPESIIKFCDCLSISADYLLRGESPFLGALPQQEQISTLTPKQREALSRVVEGFLSAFEKET